VLSIIESRSRVWALTAADGDLRLYSREEAGEWSEVVMSEDSEQIDQDGRSILEALYEQYATTDGDQQTAAPEPDQEEPEDEEELPEDEGEPEDEEAPFEDEEEPEDEAEEPAQEDEEEEKPRRSRGRTRAEKK
jgi:hypothetical protein